MSKNPDIEVVDAHVHIFPKKQAKVVYDWVKEFGFKVDELYEPSKIVKYLTESGVEKAFIVNFAHNPGTAKDINDWTLSICEDYEKLIPFGTVHPEGEEVREEAERALNLGCRGIKLHPPAQRFHPLTDEIQSTYELLSERGKPIVFHCGFFEGRDYHQYSEPEIFEEISERFPKLKICLAHVCHFYTENLLEGKLPILQKHENIFFDTAHWFSDSFREVFNPPVNYENLVKAFKRYPDRFLFGTDFPTTGIEIKEQVENLLGMEIETEILKKIAGKNALKIINNP